MARDDQQDQRSEDAADRDPVEFGADTPPLEWAMAAVGALLVVGMLVVLVVNGIAGPTGPPVFDTHVTTTTDQGSATLLLVEVRNRGGRSAEAVMVEASVDGEELADAELDHLPPGAAEPVGLLLPAGVDPARVDVAVVGFREP